jgi:hypothetical protein
MRHVLVVTTATLALIGSAAFAEQGAKQQVPGKAAAPVAQTPSASPIPVPPPAPPRSPLSAEGQAIVQKYWADKRAGLKGQPPLVIQEREKKVEAIRAELAKTAPDIAQVMRLMREEEDLRLRFQKDQRDSMEQIIGMLPQADKLLILRDLYKEQPRPPMMMPPGAPPPPPTQPTPPKKP